jgi:hypothetical protein
LLSACEDRRFPESSGPTLSGVPLSAYQAGYRQAILDLYRDPRLWPTWLGASVPERTQCGRTTRRLGRWLELSAKRGRRTPKPREVAEAAGGKWSEIDACWQFDDLKSLPSVTHRGLCERLKDIRRKNTR